MNEPAMTAQQSKFTKGESAFSLYREMILGENASLLSLLKYEVITTLVSNLPGAIGIAFRSLLYPFILQSKAKPFLGKGITVRGGKKISLGRGVIWVIVMHPNEVLFLSLLPNDV